MGGPKRMGSVKVKKDVVIPERLLSVSKRGGRDRPDWPMDAAVGSHRRQNAQYDNRMEPEIGPVQKAVEEHKRRSLACATHPNRVSWAGVPPPQARSVARARPRKTSNPVTSRESASVGSRSFSPVEDGRPRPDSGVEAFPSLYVTEPKKPKFSMQGNNRDSEVSMYTDGCSTIYTPDAANVPKRSGTVKSIVHAVVPGAVTEKAREIVNRARSGSLYDTYEKAKIRGVELQRKRWVEIAFEVSIYVLLLSFVYFVLIGVPLWNGAVWWAYWVVSTQFVLAGGWSITLIIAAFYSFGPLLIFFEPEPPMIERAADFDRTTLPGVHDTALLIPCYKSANLVGATLEAALKIFPPSHIFVLANGNSETPLDNTEEVCIPYGVNHIWCPVGSKIVAQFVGCYAAKGFKNVLLIDDDCALPPNFPVVSDRLTDKVRSIGYTIKSVGPNNSKGTWCQQAQDMEYKISGLQRALAGKMGSATFPHGAISLWNRKFLIETFHDHPGFSVSEDWFFGHSCRRLGGRIKMCTSVFVETETPPAVFFSSGGARGGFGEMTVFKQRFLRWNFFFVNGMWYNMGYILGSWKLGWWELGAKLFVFQEVYETLLYLFTPFILPISFMVAPAFCGYLLAGTIVMYLINVVIFNEVHLRMRNERIGWTVLLVYYMPYKLALTFVNVASCYWSLYKYARYFAKRHPKIVEDEKAVEVVLRLEETKPVVGPGTGTQSNTTSMYEDEYEDDRQGGRRMSVVAVGTRLSVRMSSRLSTYSYTSTSSMTDNRHSFLPGSVDNISSAGSRSSRSGGLGLMSPTYPPNAYSNHDTEKDISGGLCSPTYSDHRTSQRRSQRVSVQMTRLPEGKTVMFDQTLDEKTTGESTIYGRRRKDSMARSAV